MAPLKLLIVEDDFSYRLELEMMLKEMGYTEPFLASDKETAESIVTAERPDLVIADIFLTNEQDGVELAKDLLLKQIPVILITSSREEGVYSQAQAALPVAYLVKPFDRFSLQSAIERTFIQRGNPVYIGQIIQQWHKQKLIKDHLFIRHNSILIKVDVKSIDYVTADGNYCYLFAGQRKFAVKSSLKALRELLTDEPFLQVNRSTLVNFYRIQEVNFSENTIKIIDKDLKIGNTYREEISSWMNRL